VAGNIVVAWVLTLPAAAVMGGLAYAVTRLFGQNNAGGPIVVLILFLAVIGAVFARRFRRPGEIAGAEA